MQVRNYRSYTNSNRDCTEKSEIRPTIILLFPGYIYMKEWFTTEETISKTLVTRAVTRLPMPQSFPPNRTPHYFHKEPVMFHNSSGGSSSSTRFTPKKGETKFITSLSLVRNQPRNKARRAGETRARAADSRALVALCPGIYRPIDISATTTKARRKACRRCRRAIESRGCCCCSRSSKSRCAAPGGILSSKGVMGRGRRADDDGSPRWRLKAEGDPRNGEVWRCRAGETPLGGSARDQWGVTVCEMRDFFHLLEVYGVRWWRVRFTRWIRLDNSCVKFCLRRFFIGLAIFRTACDLCTYGGEWWSRFYGCLHVFETAEIFNLDELEFLGCLTVRVQLHLSPAISRHREF